MGYPLLREPTLHFALLGAGIFALWGWLGEPETDPRVIEISEELTASIARQHLESTGTPATAEALDALVEAWIREEVLFREASSMGLDRGDPIVRRRLVQKLTLLLEDLAVGAPSDGELETWLAKHPERYRLLPRYAFEQVYVGDADLQRVRAALGEGASVQAVGRPFVHGVQQPLAPQASHAARFGDRFAQRLPQLPLGEWSEVQSAYGTHFVRLVERVDAQPASLDEVRAAVERDWALSKRESAIEGVVDRLVERYQVLR